MSGRAFPPGCPCRMSPGAGRRGPRALPRPFAIDDSRSNVRRIPPEKPSPRRRRTGDTPRPRPSRSRRPRRPYRGGRGRSATGRVVVPRPVAGEGGKAAGACEIPCGPCARGSDGISLRGPMPARAAPSTCGEAPPTASRPLPMLDRTAVASCPPGPRETRRRREAGRRSAAGLPGPAKIPGRSHAVLARLPVSAVPILPAYVRLHGGHGEGATDHTAPLFGDRTRPGVGGPAPPARGPPRRHRGGCTAASPEAPASTSDRGTPRDLGARRSSP